MERLGPGGCSASTVRRGKVRPCAQRAVVRRRGRPFCYYHDPENPQAFGARYRRVACATACGGDCFAEAVLCPRCWPFLQGKARRTFHAAIRAREADPAHFDRVLKVALAAIAAARKARAAPASD